MPGRIKPRKPRVFILLNQSCSVFKKVYVRCLSPTSMWAAENIVNHHTKGKGKNTHIAENHRDTRVFLLNWHRNKVSSFWCLLSVGRSQQVSPPSTSSSPHFYSDPCGALRSLWNAAQNSGPKHRSQSVSMRSASDHIGAKCLQPVIIQPFHVIEAAAMLNAKSVCDRFGTP